jgi:hypothetical protein
MSTIPTSLSITTQTTTPLPPEPRHSFICPLTNNIMIDPVIDKHGHTFEKTALFGWLKNKPTCPLKNEPIDPSDLNSNQALKEIIDLYQTKSPAEVQNASSTQDPTIPQPSKQEQNDTLAKALLSSAQGLEDTNQFQNAEALYITALQYTSKSQDYAHLPRLFEKKGEKERAFKTYLVLADLQINEGNKIEATVTLKKALQLTAQPSTKEKLAHLLQETRQNPEAALLFLELSQQALYNKDTLKATTFCSKALQAFPGYAEIWKTLAALQHDTSQTLKILFQGANEPTIPLKDRLGLCKTIALKDPDNLQIQLLFLKLNQLKMKNKIKQLKQIDGQKIQNLELTLKELLSEKETRLAKKEEKLRIAEQAQALEAQKAQQKQLQPVAIPDMAFGKAMWAKYFGNIGVEPPLPADIEQILNSACPFWQGKRVRDTHFLTLIPASVDNRPFTLDSLQELIQKPKEGQGTKYSSYWDPIQKEWGSRAPTHSYWVLMTRDVIPGSRNKKFDEHKRIASQNEHYEMPCLLEAAASILLGHVRTGAHFYSDNPYTYTRCQERVTSSPSHPLIVGGFSSAGLSVDYNSLYDTELEHNGVGTLRRL